MSMTSGYANKMLLKLLMRIMDTSKIIETGCLYISSVQADLCK
jgi:hypothetical protein